MASLKTIRKTMLVIERMTKIFHPFDVRGVLMDRRGIVSNWGKGKLAEERKRLGPGILERAYRELPKNMLQRFVLLTGDTAPEPTKEEFAKFERRLLETVRHILSQEVKKRIDKLPPPVGRRERKRERTQLIKETVRQYEKKRWTRTRAVKQTATDLNIDRATVWRHLAGAKKNRQNLPHLPAQPSQRS